MARRIVPWIILALAAAATAQESGAPAEALASLEAAHRAIAGGDLAGALAPAQAAAAAIPDSAATGALAADAAATLALAQLEPEADTAEELRPLILALTRAEAAGAPAAPVLVAGWTAVLERLAAAGRWRDAEIAADRALGLLDMLDVPPVDLRLAAAQAGARAALNTGQYDVAEWRYLWGAAGLAPLGEDGGVDPVWADLRVRAAAARAAHRSLDMEFQLVVPAVRAPQDVAQPQCAPEWVEAPAARLSRSYRRATLRPRPGAVLVAFEITPEGRTHAARMVAVAPGRKSRVCRSCSRGGA